MGLQKNNDPHSLKNKLITSMRYKIIALLCALSIIGLIITLLALFAREDGFIIKASLIAACILITIYAINKGANLDNAALLKSLNTNKFVWVTHRGPSTAIDFKINNRTLQPYGVFASSKFQRILGKTFLEFIDGTVPVLWVSLGRPSDSPSILLGKVNFWEWDKAVTFQVAPSKISAPDSLFKKIFGKHQLVIREDIPLTGKEDIYIKKKLTWHKVL